MARVAKKELTPTVMRELGEMVKMSKVFEAAGLDYSRLNAKLYRPNATFTEEEKEKMKAALGELKVRLAEIV